MKNQLLLLVVLTMIVISCRKDQSLTETSPISPTDVLHSFTINGKLTQVLEKAGVYYAAEDLILSTTQFNLLKSMSDTGTSTTPRSTTINNLSQTWPNGVVYYSLGSTTKTASIAAAMAHISSLTSITFVQRTNQSNYVEFRNSTGNSSNLGMIGGRQYINLYNDIMGITAHEILHSLGIHHEQTRPDRDQYIIINWDNIVTASQFNYTLATSYTGVGTFDFDSIMLYYPYNGFNIDYSIPTMTRLDGTTWPYQRTALSSGDIAGINYIYGN